MANVNVSFEYLMSWEDPKKSGVVTTDAGGRTRFGWAERYNRDLAATGFYEMPTADALVLAKQRTIVKYWKPMQGDLILRQCVADKILSMGFNLWLPTVVVWVQSSLGLHEDGIVGAETLAQINVRWAQALAAIYNNAAVKYSTEPESIREGLMRRANG